MQQRFRTWGAAFCMICLTIGAQAQDWANWRGPQYNGSSNAKNLPINFSPTNNVKWVVDLPGSSAATPIVWKDCVFVSSIDTKAQSLVAMCLDRKTGKKRWQHDVGSGYMAGGEGNRIQLDERSTYSAPSPVTDGKRVIFFYGNGDLIAFDLAGNKLWARNLQREYGDFCFQWTFSSSPQLYEGKLYMQILQRNQTVGRRGKNDSPSFLLALAPDSGKELWRHQRPSKAQVESLEAYSTPIPHTSNGRKELIIAGGDALTGHDPKTGQELWRWETWNPNHRETYWRLVPSPVVGGGIVLACAPKRAPVYAAKAGGTGTVPLVWKSEDRSAVTSDVPTPLYYADKFYVLSDVRKSLSCVEPATGNVTWSVPLPGTQMHWGSPTGADGKIYIMNLNGEVTVVEARSGKVLATNTMAPEERDIRSTIAVAYDALFIRTNTKLYCIGN